jgi:hypothetical protein
MGCHKPGLQVVQVASEVALPAAQPKPAGHLEIHNKHGLESFTLFHKPLPQEIHKGSATAEPENQP